MNSNTINKKDLLQDLENLIEHIKENEIYMYQYNDYALYFPSLPKNHTIHDMQRNVSYQVVGKEINIHITYAREDK